MENVSFKEAISQWHDNFLEEEKFIPHNGILYHYTTKNAFCQIMESGHFHMTNYQDLDDKTEFNHSLNILKKCLLLKSNQFSPEVFGNLLQLFGLSDEKSLGEPEPFVFSLSEDCGSIYKWRVYAEDGNGICIGIEPPKEGERYYRNLYKVIYEIEEQEKIVEQKLSEYLDILKNYKDESKSLNRYSALFEVLTFLRVRFKNPSFSIEKEWRYAAFPTPLSNINEKQFKIAWNRNGICKYFEEQQIRDSNGKLPIREIWVGPRLKDGKGEDFVYDVLIETGYDFENIKVDQINIPLK